MNKKEIKWKYEIGQVIKDNKRDIIITERKYIEGKGKCYKYKCKKCSFDCGEYYSSVEKISKQEYWTTEFYLNRGSGCICCCSSSKAVVKGINDINTTNPEMIIYFKNIEDTYIHTYSSNDTVWFKCPDCESEKYMKINKLKHQGFSCKKCSDGKSAISKYMFSILEQLKFHKQINDFDIEIRYDWCQFYNPYKTIDTYGIYDFVIEEKQIIIETDGGWHREDNNMSGQSKEESEWLDDEKDRLAEEHGYKVIRISDEGDIKDNILSSDLNKLFDLSIIDWNECIELSLKTLVRKVCDYWKVHNEVNYENLTTLDLHIYFKLNRYVITKYLTQGSIIGWCNYNAKEEMRKSATLLHISNCKEVKVYKKDDYLGKFNSIKYLEENSLELFGLQLCAKNISAVCNGRVKTHKGFRFEFC